MTAIGKATHGSPPQTVNRAELEQFFADASTHLHQIDDAPVSPVSRLRNLSAS